MRASGLRKKKGRYWDDCIHKDYSMAMRSLIIRTRTWWIRHARIRVLVNSFLFGVLFYVSSLVLDRDVAYLWMVGATGFCLVALIWATNKTPATGDSLTHPIFALFIGMVLANVYRYAFVALDRPPEMFAGLAFSLFIGVCGYILGTMLEYLRTIGHMQASRDPRVGKRYKIAFWAIIGVSLIAALFVYHDL